MHEVNLIGESKFLMLSIIKENQIRKNHDGTPRTYMQYLVINCKSGKIELNIKNDRSEEEKAPASDYEFFLLGVISKATAGFSAEKPGDAFMRD